MRTASRKSHYFPALDGLRGVAILLVITHHNFKFTNYFFFGWLGVDLFFVLSGFLITDILLRALDKPDFLKNFYIRRILRIFPLFYLTLVICLLILPHIKSLHLNAAYYTENQVWLWAYLQNWLFIFKEPYGDQILLHTWSLAVEEQFYLIWPLIIFLVRKPKVLMCIAIGVFVLAVLGRYAVWSYQIIGFPYWTFFNFTRIDGLCVGCSIALLMRVYPDFLKRFMFLIVGLFATINFGFYFINSQYNFSLPYLGFAGYSTFTLLFGLLVYEAVRGKSRVIMFVFDNRFLKFFGKISYGLYVYHWPINILLFDYLKNWTIQRNLAPYRMAELVSAILISIIAVIISVISYSYFEKRFLKLKERFS